MPTSPSRSPPQARRNFLIPIKALARLVRGMFRALLRRTCPDLAIPRRGVAHALDPPHHRLGHSEQAVLDYLARYVFRIALTNARIVSLDDRTVGIR